VSSMSGPQVLARVAQEGSPVGVGIDKAVVGGVVYVGAADVTQAAATATIGPHNLCARLMVILITKIPFMYSQKRNCAGRSLSRWINAVVSFQCSVIQINKIKT
jgi:hypothetical protein